jgi:hypothetical protein
VADPVFGELRNCMQLALVGALVVHERLMERADCSLPAMAQDSMFKTAELPAPTQVDSRTSMVKSGNKWNISVSGGVNIRPGEIVSKAQESAAPVEARGKAVRTGKSCWYWN